MRILNTRGDTNFWQWDTGRKLVILGDEDNCGEAQFCTGSGDPFPVTIRMEEGLRVVDVPDEVLQTARPFTVYLIRTEAGGDLTRHAQRFNVFPKTKPSDYIHTPSERQTWEQLDERIEALEQNGPGSVSEEQIAEAVSTYMTEHPIDPGVDEQEIRDIVDEYLAENLTPDAPDSGQNVELDTTLTQSGKAADAKAVGDALAKVGKPTDEQVQEAVQGYLEKNPVPADEWPLLIPTLNGIHPINTITNERSVRTKSVQLNAPGTKAHNLAMCKIDAGVFATWAEFASVDNANGGGQCFQRWAIINPGVQSAANPVNWTAANNTFSAAVLKSGTLYDGATVAAGAITDASDACVFRISGTKVAVMAKVTPGVNTPYTCTAIMEFATDGTPTITYHEPTINGGEWNMKNINSAWDRWYQFNNEPVLAGSEWFVPVVVNYKGVQILKTSDGIDFAPAFFVPCEYAHLEAALTMSGPTRFFLAIRSHYSNGDLYLSCGEVSTDGGVTVNGQRRIAGCGCARPHIVKTSTQNVGGSTGDMPFFVVCTDANRRNGHLFRVRTYGKWGGGSIISADEICTFPKYAVYPVHLDCGNFNNFSDIMPIRFQLMGATDQTKNIVSVFPVACVSGVDTAAYRDGVDWATRV